MQNSLGIITPEITRSLGFISPEAVRTLGIITPDITRSIGETPLNLSIGKRVFMGAPLSTWGVVVGMSTVGAGLAGYAATRSPKGYLLSALGGLIGSAGGVAVAGYLTKRSVEKLVASTQAA